MVAAFIKYWKWPTIALLAALAALAPFHPFLVRNIFWTFANAESSIASWTKEFGVPFPFAVALAIAVSSIDICVWFVLYFHAKEFYEGDRTRSAPVAGAGKFFYRIGHGAYRYLIPPPPERPVPRAFAGYTQAYLWLAICGFTPTLMWKGVGYGTSLSMRPVDGVPTWTAWLAIVIGNAGKMFIWGYFSLWIPLWSVVLVVWIAPLLISLSLRAVARRRSDLGING